MTTREYFSKPEKFPKCIEKIDKPRNLSIFLTKMPTEARGQLDLEDVLTSIELAKLRKSRAQAQVYARTAYVQAQRALQECQAYQQVMQYCDKEIARLRTGKHRKLSDQVFLDQERSGKKPSFPYLVKKMLPNRGLINLS